MKRGELYQLLRKQISKRAHEHAYINNGRRVWAFKDPQISALVDIFFDVFIDLEKITGVELMEADDEEQRERAEGSKENIRAALQRTDEDG